MRSSVLIVAFVLSACHPRPAPDSEVGTRPSMEVTREEIRRSGVGTAWQALRLLGGSLRLEEDPQGLASRVRVRGRTSIQSAREPQFVLDGIRITDYRMLQAIPASSVEHIQLITGPDAIMMWGPDAVQGVVVVRTRRGG